MIPAPYRLQAQEYSTERESRAAFAGNSRGFADK
jgi:hypothetical protein